MCLHIIKLNLRNSIRLRWLFGAAFLNKDSKLTSQVSLTYSFQFQLAAIVAEEPKQALVHLPRLTFCLAQLTHSLRYNSNCLGPKTEIEIAHIEIPISNFLYLVLPSEASDSDLFRTNASNLLKAIKCQGKTKTQELEKIQTSLNDFLGFLGEIAYDEVTSDHVHQRGNKLISHWENEEAEQFSTPQGIAFINTT